MRRKNKQIRKEWLKGCGKSRKTRNERGEYEATDKGLTEDKSSRIIL